MTVKCYIRITQKFIDTIKHTIICGREQNKLTVITKNYLFELLVNKLANKLIYKNTSV